MAAININLLRLLDQRDRMDATLEAALSTYAERLKKRTNAELRELARCRKVNGARPGGSATKAELVEFLVKVWELHIEDQRKKLDAQIAEASRPATKI